MASRRFIDGPPDGIEGWKRVWEEDLSPRPRRGLLDDIRRFFGKLIAGEQLSVQRNYNIALTEMLADHDRDVEAIRRRLEEAAAALERIDTILPIAVDRNDALFAVLDQKIESALSRFRDLTLPRLSGPEASQQLRDDWSYRRLEEHLRGSPAEIRTAMRELLPYLSGPLIDVGCGRGELLEVCREEAIDARGFDVNERSVAELQEKGLAAEIGRLPECLASLDEGAASTIAAIHVVEHLPTEALFGLFAEAGRVLRRGGRLVIETPNASSLAMTGSDFWKDPSHLAPRHPAALVTLGREYGFGVELMDEVHPWPADQMISLPEGAPEISSLVERLNEILYPPQDFRLVLSNDG